MATVFIVNEPNPDHIPAGRPAYDTTPARAFGRIVFVFPKESPTPVVAPALALDRAHEILSEAKVGDFIAWAGGDPLGMVIAASLLADYTDGQFNYLKWDREAKAYVPVPITLFNGDE